MYCPTFSDAPVFQYGGSGQPPLCAIISTLSHLTRKKMRMSFLVKHWTCYIVCLVNRSIYKISSPICSTYLYLSIMQSRKPSVVIQALTGPALFLVPDLGLVCFHADTQRGTCDVGGMMDFATHSSELPFYLAGDLSSAC